MPEPEPKLFDLGDVLSVTTDRLVARDHVGALYALLNFMTGDNLFTHQLPRAMNECRPALLAQHPALAGIEPPAWPDGVDPADVFAWVDSLRPTLGDQLPVVPLDPADHTRIDPISELGLLGVPPEKIIVVTPEADRG